MGRGQRVAASIKRCVFCDEAGKKVTRGHIFGQQLLDELPRPAPGVPFLSKVMMLDPQTNAWSTVAERDPRSPYHMPVNVICESCNGAWMGTIETDFRGVLVKAQEQATCRFTRHPLDLLALWVSVVSILSQYVHKSTVITPVADRLYVRSNSLPAPGTHIWLAQSAEGPASIVGMMHALDGRITEDDNDGTGHRYIYGLIFGPFAALLIGGLVIDGFEPELITKPAGAFQRIWPRQGSFRWSATAPRASAMDLEIFRKQVAAYLMPMSPPLTAPLEILQRRGRHDDAP
jgi:hypothetical protein